MNANRMLFQAHLDHSKKLKEIHQKLSTVFDVVKTRNPSELSNNQLLHVVNIMSELNKVNNFVVAEYVDALELAECMVVEGRV